MKKILTLGLCLAFGSSLLVMNSCKKIVDDAAETTETAEDYADDQQTLAELSDMVFDILDQDAQLKKANSQYLPEGTSIIWSDSLMSDGDGVEFKIVFSPELPEDPDLDDETLGTLCQDNNIRGGEISVEVTKPLDEVGCRIHIDLSKGLLMSILKSNKRKIVRASDKIIIKKVASDTWEFSYSFKVYYKVNKGGKRKDKRTKSTGTMTIIQTTGLSTPDVNDDVFEVTGSGSGDNSSSRPYKVSISEKLVRKGDPSCSKTFVSGKLKLKNDGSKFDIETDFGDGTCDNLVKVIINKVEKTITVD